MKGVVVVGEVEFGYVNGVAEALISNWCFRSAIEAAVIHNDVEEHIYDRKKAYRLSNREQLTNVIHPRTNTLAFLYHP